jgi:hypothetical protein
MAERVDLARVARPMGVIRLPFQVGILAATLSTMICSCSRFSLEVERGVPR